MKKTLFIGLVIILALVGVRYFSARTRGPEPSKESLTFIIKNDVPSFDNAKIADTTTFDVLFMRIYESLIVYEEGKGSFVPLLAESLSVSDDGTRIEFVLRRNVRFHDGSTFDSFVVRKNMLRFMDSQTSPVLSQMLSSVREVQAPNADKIVFILKSPDASFLAVLSTIGFASASAIDSNFSGGPMGTGPFRMASRDPGKNIKLSKSDNYWGASPSIKGIVFSVVPDEVTQVLALRNKQAELLKVNDLSPQLSVLLENGDFKLVSTPANNVTGIYFNLKDEQLAERNLRVALTMAIDREVVVSLLDGFATRAHGPIPSIYAMSGKEEEGYPYDLAEAQELFAKTGAQKPIRLLYIGSPSASIVTGYVAEQWKKMGVKVELEEVDTAGFINRVLASHDFQAALIGLSNPSPDPGFFLQFAFPTNASFIGYANGLYDQMIERLRTTRDPSAKQQIMMDAQKVVIDDALAVFLYSGHVGLFYDSKAIANVKVDPIIPTKFLEQITLISGDN